MAPTSTPQTPFGRVLTAMVTPFTADGALDLDGAQRLATHLVDAGDDGLIINGTTGESPTTSDAEKSDLVRAVLEAVGDRAHIVAGVGTNDTRHSIELARAAEKAGAHGLLTVTPYYNKPPQEGLYRHFSAIADADRAAGDAVRHPRSQWRTDQHRNPRAAGRAPAYRREQGRQGRPRPSQLGHRPLRTDLVLRRRHAEPPLLSVGAVGFVSVVGHVVTPELRAMERHVSGNIEGHRDPPEAAPRLTGMFRTQGVMTTKAALALQGLPAGPLRAPMVELSPEETTSSRSILLPGGVEL